MENYIEVNNMKLNVLYLLKKDNKDFIVYELPNGEISASIYKYVDGKLQLEEIITEEDWKFIENEVGDDND